MSEAVSYHHGNLRTTVLVEVVKMLSEDGANPSTLSLRAVARRTGVTPPSVAHHFRDKAGLFAAIAAEGFELLHEELSRIAEEGGSFLDLGVGYVRFATTHKGHFSVMYRPDLYGEDDEKVLEARRRDAELLFAHAGEIAEDPDDPESTLTAGMAGWALVHGLATLWLDRNIPPAGAPSELGADPEELTRRVARLLGPGGAR